MSNSEQIFSAISSSTLAHNTILFVIISIFLLFSFLCSWIFLRWGRVPFCWHYQFLSFSRQSAFSRLLTWCTQFCLFIFCILCGCSGWWRLSSWWWWRGWGSIVESWLVSINWKKKIKKLFYWIGSFFNSFRSSWSQISTGIFRWVQMAEKIWKITYPMINFNWFVKNKLFYFLKTILVIKQRQNIDILQIISCWVKSESFLLTLSWSVLHIWMFFLHLSVKVFQFLDSLLPTILKILNIPVFSPH